MAAEPTISDREPYSEYRACGTYTNTLQQTADCPATITDTGPWRLDRDHATRDLSNLDATHPRFLRTWLEMRKVTRPVEVVILSEEPQAVSPGLERFLASLNESIERRRAA